MTSSKSSKHYKAHYSEVTCVLCGSRQIDHGRILHGHCVCEDCLEYIVSEDPPAEPEPAARPDEPAADEAVTCDTSRS